MSLYPVPTKIYTLSLHDALPISIMGIEGSIAWREGRRAMGERKPGSSQWQARLDWSESWDSDLTLAGRDGPAALTAIVPLRRSEEHTSELQSHSDLVCRLLLEKK